MQDRGKTWVYPVKGKKASPYWKSLPLLEKHTPTTFVNIDAEGSLTMDNCGSETEVDGSKSIIADGLLIIDRIVTRVQKDPKKASSFKTNNIVANA
ncbi:hypothetical protein ACH5RR_033719 [Cinchona calisaya]|uniref:Uncharacterized protein n=1 Tax=Cinchona calisaya TaxID=153742 RepID=A0ABD2Y8S1_9GENT